MIDKVLISVSGINLLVRSSRNLIKAFFIASNSFHSAGFITG